MKTIRLIAGSLGVLLGASGCASVGGGPSQSPPPAERIAVCAPVFYGFAPETAESCIHPHLASEFESPADMVQRLSALHERVGDAITVLDIDEPGPVQAIGDHAFSVVPLRVRLQDGDFERLQTSYLVGILDPGAAQWTFVDGSSYAEPGFVDSFPGIDTAALASTLVVPPVEILSESGPPPTAPNAPAPAGDADDFVTEERRRAVECHETADRLKAQGLDAYAARVRSTCPDLE